MRALRRAAVVLAAAMALLVGHATSAAAGISATSVTIGGYAVFQDYGDKFIVCDKVEDGWSVYVEYTYIRIDGSEQSGTHYNSNGYNTCFMFDHDFGEGRTVNFRACTDRWVLDSCDNWRVGVA